MSAEARRSFACFGGTVTVLAGDTDAERAEELAADAERRLLASHCRLSRFLPESELCRLNRDPRQTVPVSRLLLEVAACARWAGVLSGGLVDATLVEAIERAGYAGSLAGRDTSAAPPPASGRRSAAAPSPERGWSRIEIDRDAGTVSRPPDLAIDSGGIAKGLLADLVGATLRELAGFAVDCCGDVAIGGTAGRPRPVLVENPAGGEPLRELAVSGGGVATSGIGRRSWDGPEGPRHHLLDPASGEPAFTGVVQATALAPSAFLAEVYAKWALLSGPAEAHSHLPYGGVLVLDDGVVVDVPAPAGAPVAA